MAWANGVRVDINLDQGAGFYRTKAYIPFDFSTPSDVQAQKLAKLRIVVENQSPSMPIYVLKPV
jgi:uncharacterized membrane protein